MNDLYKMVLCNGHLYLDGELVKGIRSYSIEHDNEYDMSGVSRLTLELKVINGESSIA